MKEQIERIFKTNFDRIIGDENLISIFVIGSMAGNDYIEKKSNDYDIRFILNEQTKDSYERILEFLDVCKKEIEELGYGCEVSDVIGPVKMENKKEKNVLLHSIIMTQKELDGLPSIHKYSYSMNYHKLYGEDLVTKYRQLSLKPNDVIFADEGIEFCIQLLKTGKNSYLKWYVENDSLVLKREYVDLDEVSTIELFNYSYKKAVNNISNMAVTSGYSYDNCSIEYTDKEKELIEKINSNNLSIEDTNDKDILISILYKLEKLCLDIYKQNNKKTHYNSLDWGIIEGKSNNVRGEGFEFLEEINAPIGKNFSLPYKDYLENKKKLNNIIKDSNYIVIFEPPCNLYQRYGVGDVNTIDIIDEYIKEKELKLDEYNISFIEKIDKCKDSFAGTAMSDGKGQLVVEVIINTCDSRELTSKGADSSLIRTYRFSSFDDYTTFTPDLIKQIKDICQYFSGYYEFAYGEIRNKKDIYFTFYSKNGNYINIFEGGKVKWKNITK